MPKHAKPRAPKSQPKRAAKPQPKRAKASSKPSPARAKRATKTAAAGTRASNAIDPRVLAAIGLALEDERIAAERSAALESGTSGWLALARTRGVRER